MTRSLTFFLILVMVMTSVQSVSAQNETPSPGPVYIIQPGDTLWDIAFRFNITIEELLAANPDVDADFISVGQQLVIPGLEGISGILTTEVIPLGDTYRSLSRRYQITASMLQKLNRVVSPTEFYAGASLVIPVSEQASALQARRSLKSGETLLEFAIRQHANPWTLTEINAINAPSQTLPGDVLHIPSEETGTQQQANGFPTTFVDVLVTPLPLTQGNTTEIFITSPANKLGGLLVDKPLQFIETEPGRWVALQGIHAMLEPGVYPIKLEAILDDGSQQSFEQLIIVESGYYPDDPDLYIQDATTIDMDVSDAEFEQIQQMVAKVTPERYWDGVFISPAGLFPEPNCFTSRFGNRRAYKTLEGETKLLSFHSGQDFCGGSGLPITAPAAGIVVFAGSLTVRGNAVLIDHGWGIYSGYWHQSEIMVSPGEHIEPGDLIGYVGSTGRVTGAHLHWEIWVNGVQVNPLDWLEQEYP